ncbi:hypothetical protein K8R61_03060 [bacterium]|nr:hypothetical protein [bacterium]
MTKIQKNDWYKGATGELSFFMTHEIIKGYNHMFLKYQHTLFNVLFYIEDGILTMIRKKSEMKTLMDYIESLSEKYIVQQLKIAVELNKKLEKRLRGLILEAKTWQDTLALCEKLWTYNMFCIYFGYATERKKIKKISDKNYNLVVEARNGINNLQILDDFLKNYFSKIDLTELTADEIKKFFINKSLPSKKDMSERREKYLLFMKNLKTKKIIKNNIRKTISKYLIEKDYNNLKKLKGVVVFKKNVSGPACVILKKKNLSTIQEGEILVTIMTSPEYVPYLSRVAGIVTNEGGITCHASIIAREMKIPCIVGTKIATKIFKNGDVINIDVDNQIVEKIQVKNNSK